MPRASASATRRASQRPTKNLSRKKVRLPRTFLLTSLFGWCEYSRVTNIPTLREQVRAYLKAHGMTQEDLAAAVGISASHLSEIVNGKTPSLRVAVALARITNIPESAFLAEPSAEVA